MTSLYIGHDQLALTESLRQALSSNPNLEIHILLDQLRSLRGVTKGTSSVDLLLPLIKEFGANSTSSTYSPSSSPPPPPRFSLSLYHSPLLSGIYKHITPPRFNEAFGLQHMKTYIFDKDLILSGANLNKDYFVNRQDRYIAFNGEKLLTDYYTDLCQTVARFSHNVVSSSSTSFHMEPPAQDSPPAPQMMSDFMKRWESSKAPCTDHHHNHHRPYWSIPMSKISQAVTDPSSSCLLGSSNSNNNTSSSNTLVIPLIQMGLYGIRQEEAIISNLLETVSNANASNVKKNVSIGRQSSLWNIYLASAYLNFPDSYITSLFSWNQSLSSSPSFSSSSSTTPTSSSISSLSSSISNSSTSSSVDIITASPRANGFYSSKGVSRHLPSAYTYLEILFMRAVEKLKRISTTTNQLNVHEYERGDGWTFHAKGVWISSSIPTTTTTTTATSSPLFITLIGSSNLGKRSMYRDLESTGLIVTRDEGLNRRLEEV